MTCFDNKTLRARPFPYGDRADDIAAVREDLIVNRVTHLDYLADKLRENRVRRVIEPMLSGTDRHTFTDRDVTYARDLGLLACDAPLRVANPIYAEVLPRELAWVAQETLDLAPPRYVRPDGSLDAELLMAEFQSFFRHHSEHWRNRFAYAEAWPQLLLQAYLQRVVNGGGRLEREYALGSGRVDLLIVWPLAERVQEFVVECKVVREHDGLESVVDEGRGADGTVYGRQRGRSGAPGRHRPAGEPELGGEGLSSPARRRRGAGRRVGHVTGVTLLLSRLSRRGPCGGGRACAAGAGRRPATPVRACGSR